jgi:hypothetical protein
MTTRTITAIVSKVVVLIAGKVSVIRVVAAGVELEGGIVIAGAAAAVVLGGAVAVEGTLHFTVPIACSLGKELVTSIETMTFTVALVTCPMTL